MQRAKRPLAAAALAAIFAALTAAPLTTARAADEVTLPVVLPLTGGGAFLGGQFVKNYNALADVLNKQGGIKGQKVVFNFNDDQSSPQQDVQIAGSLIAQRPPVILGSAIVALCNSMAPLMRNGPVMYCLSPSFEPAKGGYTFSAGVATRDQIAAIVRYFRMKGWTKIALLNSTDTTGQNADKDIKGVLAKDENKGVEIVSQEHFTPGDLSVGAQIQRIKSSGAQAIIAWTTGTPVATIFKGMIQAGLDLPIGTSSGNQNFAQMDQFKDFLPKRVVMGSALFPPHEGIVQLDPKIEAAQKAMNEALAAHGMKADIATACGWDAVLITTAALRELGPNAKPAQVRDWIANLTDFAGINGVYDFKKYPDRGLGPDSVTVVSYDPNKKEWVWLSKPGGAPL
jgi:branched-chain amino acid transport system substrate-binding protein